MDLATDALALAALASAAIWAWLLAGHGRFWRADQRLGRPPPPSEWPDVVAVIPARDEAETVAQTLSAHGATTYPGRFSVILVDDASTDGTGEIARSVAEKSARPIRIVPAPPLPPGWTGKLWALEAGLAAADTHAPRAEYVLLTDADILHAPETLARLVAKAHGEARALVSLMARLDDRGLWGGLLIPAFVFFFQKLYPFPRVNDPERAEAGAAGGCVLLRRDTLAAIGGIAAIRTALIDDCTLAGRVKTGPPRRSIWLGLAEDEVISLRDNRALASVWKMVARTAFTQLDHSPLRLAGTLAGMALVYMAGPVAALVGVATGAPGPLAAGALASGLSAIAYAPTLALYGRPRWQALGLPAAAALFTLMTLDSARAHWAGRGGAWKGRSYPKPADQ